MNTIYIPQRITTARNIAEQPHRQRAYRELERARQALERMENNRG